MHLPLEVLLDGVMRTLRDAVLPAVQGRFARGQLFAVLDVLHNLRDRIEPRGELDAAEADSAAKALAGVVAALGPDAGAPLARALADAPPAPAAARAAALRAALGEAVEAVAAAPEPAASRARAALATHLAGQAMRDVACLKPSLLQEISKGDAC